MAAINDHSNRVSPALLPRVNHVTPLSLQNYKNKYESDSNLK